MHDLETLEREIERLDDISFAAFRDWFIAYEHARWDRRIERDSGAGKLDSFIDGALNEHRQGKSTPL